MTHPALITDEEWERYFDALRQGKSKGSAARVIAWNPNLIRNRMEAHPELAEREQEAIGEFLDSTGDWARGELIERAKDRDDRKSFDALVKVLDAYTPEFAKTAASKANGETPEVRIVITAEGLREALGRVVATQDARRMENGTPAALPNRNGKTAAGGS